MWVGLSQVERQEYLNLSHFNWEIFTFITGVEENSDVEVEKAIKLLMEKGLLKDGKIINNQ